MPSPYPPAPPVVAGNTITVSAFLNTPTRVQRAIEALTLQRFIADVIFGAGPAVNGGSVMYDQLLGPDDIFTGRDVQEIEPGSEFPILNTGERMPLVAIARKYGGEIMLTDEAVRRDNRNLLNREMTRLRNTIIRKVDTVAMAALAAAPTQTMAASADWSLAATDVVADLATAASLVSSLDMGYVADTVLVNPAQSLDLVKDKDIRDAMPRERDNSLIRTGNLGRVLGLDFIESNRVPAGTVYVLQRRIAGGISDEVPLYARPIPDARRETTFIHGARVVVPYVTDPKAVVRITGA